MSSFADFVHLLKKSRKMESESDSDITKKFEKAKAERKAEIKKKPRKENRNIKAR